MYIGLIVIQNSKGRPHTVLCMRYFDFASDSVDSAIKIHPIAQDCLYMEQYIT